MKMLQRGPALALGLGLIFSLSAQAQSCSWNLSKDFFSCDNFGLLQSVGRAVVSQSEVLSAIPAALPALPTPVGVEAMLSNRTALGKSGQTQVSLLKGFGYVGLGLGTLDVVPFSGADLGDLFSSDVQYQQAYDSYQDDANLVKGSRFGLSVMPPLGPISKLLHLQAGVSVGRSKDSSQYSPTYGVSSDFRWLSFGYSVGKLIINDRLPGISNSTFNVGLQLQQLYAAYSASVFHSAAGGERVVIYSLRWAGDKLGLYGALKNYGDRKGGKQSWQMAKLDWRINSHFTAGYIYGLYRYSHSAFLDFFF